MTSCLLFCLPTPSEKGHSLKGKNFSHREQFIPLNEGPFSEERQTLLKELPPFKCTNFLNIKLEYMYFFDNFSIKLRVNSSCEGVKFSAIILIKIYRKNNKHWDRSAKNWWIQIRLLLKEYFQGI